MTIFFYMKKCISRRKCATVSDSVCNMMKHGVPKAARRYHKNREFVCRQLQKYDGTVRSLAVQSRQAHSHKYQQMSDELSLIRRICRCNGKYGLAAMCVRCRSKGYARNFGCMFRQICQRGFWANRWRSTPVMPSTSSSLVINSKSISSTFLRSVFLSRRMEAGINKSQPSMSIAEAKS